MKATKCPAKKKKKKKKKRWRQERRKKRTGEKAKRKGQVDNLL